MSALRFATLLFAFLCAFGGAAYARQTSNFVKAPSPRALPRMDAFDAQSVPHRLRQLAATYAKGRYALLLFWMEACRPCVDEMPDIDAALEDPKTNPVPIPIAVASAGNIEIPLFLRRHDLKHIAPLWVPGPAHMIPLGPVPTLPFGILVDPSGQEIGRGIGMYLWENDDLKAQLSASR